MNRTCHVCPRRISPADRNVLFIKVRPPILLLSLEMKYARGKRLKPRSTMPMLLRPINRRHTPQLSLAPRKPGLIRRQLNRVHRKLGLIRRQLSLAPRKPGLIRKQLRRVHRQLSRVPRKHGLIRKQPRRVRRQLSLIRLRIRKPSRVRRRLSLIRPLAAARKSPANSGSNIERPANVLGAAKSESQIDREMRDGDRVIARRVKFRSDPFQMLFPSVNNRRGHPHR